MRRSLSKVSRVISVYVLLYSPQRPLVDVAEVFLWLMAVGTILCASFWSEWSAIIVAIEQDKLLKVCVCVFCFDNSYFIMLCDTFYPKGRFLLFMRVCIFR